MRQTRRSQKITPQCMRVQPGKPFFALAAAGGRLILIEILIAISIAFFCYLNTSLVSLIAGPGKTGIVARQDKIRRQGQAKTRRGMHAVYPPCLPACPCLSLFSFFLPRVTEAFPSQYHGLWPTCPYFLFFLCFFLFSFFSLLFFRFFYFLFSFSSIAFLCVFI